ncbi:16S rRNA (guanine(966)-N(2))-methyltransferase RsmD [Luteimonas fraxinea]|uniref:16S rRNA (guanine(966)-N(2))-methyltransferase RsmD n=1 Tax=Luteimonas fraxinea TaxID=2901869 RepID=UPI001E52CEDD|nr:16S rRNA (guanine(966)-N(2))-methyltransferase RsmD [Luteimonas fraxinea]MCD9125545.1 16S rRNA (guanine(966)-N(2))-methyltransferase RsmD [Luteimonas fraxinea]
MKTPRSGGSGRSSPNVNRNTGPGRVRIVGGRWRGTRLDVPDVAGLRPTSDRVRETLFNWLLPVLPGARVLDLFAGTGALGLEAVSRGAASAVLVERDLGLAAALTATAARLSGSDVVSVQRGDAVSMAGALPAGSIDIAFVDPPFAADLWAQAFAALAPALAADAWLYVESMAERPAQPGPGWQLHRELATREAHCALYRRAG